MAFATSSFPYCTHCSTLVGGRLSGWKVNWSATSGSSSGWGGVDWLREVSGTDCPRTPDSEKPLAASTATVAINIPLLILLNDWFIAPLECQKILSVVTEESEIPSRTWNTALFL